MKNLTQHYINGQWVSSVGGQTMHVENPSTETKIAMIALGSSEDAVMPPFWPLIGPSQAG